MPREPLHPRSLAHSHTASTHDRTRLVINYVHRAYSSVSTDIHTACGRPDYCSSVLVRGAMLGVFCLRVSMCTVQHGVRYSVGYLLQCLLSGFLGWRRGDGGGGMAVGAGGMAVSPIRWQVANAPLSCRRGLEMLFFNQIKESPFRFRPVRHLSGLCKTVWTLCERRAHEKHIT